MLDYLVFFSTIYFECIPRQYFVNDDPVSGWISLLSIFIASLFAWLPENVSGVMSGQSILEFGFFVDDGFSKQPSFSPKASWLQTRYLGSEKLCRT